MLLQYTPIHSIILKDDTGLTVLYKYSWFHAGVSELMLYLLLILLQRELPLSNVQSLDSFLCYSTSKHLAGSKHSDVNIHSNNILMIRIVCLTLSTCLKLFFWLSTYALRIKIVRMTDDL